MGTRENRQDIHPVADQGHIPAVLLLQILLDGEASSGEVRLRPVGGMRSKRCTFQIAPFVLVKAVASVLALVGFGVFILNR